MQSPCYNIEYYNMKSIGIVTEETVDLLPKTIKALQIAIVPVILNWPEMESMPGGNTFEKMREIERRGITSFGKTSQPSPMDFLTRYQKQLQRFDEVICITLTSKLSGSHNSALLARSLLSTEEQSRVFIVDSLTVSCGQALVVLKAIDLINSGKQVRDVVDTLQEFIHQVHLFVMFHETKWLEASGRISHVVTSLIRGLARIGVRPIMTFEKGTLIPAGLKTRAKDTADVLFKQFDRNSKKARQTGKKIRLAITHADDQESALRLKRMVEELGNVEVVLVNLINNVIGVITGPNTLAFAWSEI
jgi:DegV family protein with EDD domain